MVACAGSSSIRSSTSQRRKTIMEMPKTVTLDPGEVEKFNLLLASQKDLAARQASVQQMAKMQIAEMMRVSEARATELQTGVQKAQEEGAKLWKAIAKKYDL